jgi:integrase
MCIVDATSVAQALSLWKSQEAAATAGFPPGDVTPYVLRHMAATWMTQDGVPLWTIAGFLGHSDIRMVEKHYAHHHPDYQKVAAQAIGQRLAKLKLAPHSGKTREVTAR